MIYQIIITGLASLVLICITDTTVEANAVDPTKKEALRGYPMVYFEGEYFLENKRIQRCKEIKIFAIVAPKILESIGLTLPPPVLPEWNATPQIERQIDYYQDSCLSKLHLDPMQENKLERLAEQFIMGELTAYEVDQQLLSLRGGYTQLELVVAAFVYFLKISGGSSQAEAFSQAAMASRAAMGISAHNSLHRLNQDGNRNQNLEGNRNGNCQTRKLKASNEEYSTNSNSEYENITFPIKKVKNSMTQSDYDSFPGDPKEAQKAYAEEWKDSIKKSTEKYNIGYKKRNTCAYIHKKVDLHTGQEKIEASFVDHNSGQAVMRTTLNSDEYLGLKISDKENAAFLLTDLRRDPQTLVKNDKAIKEFEMIKTAAEQGIVDMENIRRPITYIGENTGDFVDWVENKSYELKSLTQISASKTKMSKTFEQSAEDIAVNIIEAHKPSRTQPTANAYIVSAKDIPSLDQQKECVNRIQKKLKEANLIDKIEIYFLQD